MLSNSILKALNAIVMHWLNTLVLVLLTIYFCYDGQLMRYLVYVH